MQSHAVELKVEVALLFSLTGRWCKVLEHLRLLEKELKPLPAPLLLLTNAHKLA